MRRGPFYWHSGGEVIAGGRALNSGDLRVLAALHQDERRAARAAGDRLAHRRASRLIADLAQARLAAARWRRASFGIGRNREEIIFR